MSEEKKKATFRKIEDGMVFESEDGKTLAIGLPEEVEKLKSGEGKAGISMKLIGGEAKGESYSRVKYNWHILPTKEEKLTKTQIENISGSIAIASGTVPVGYSTYIPYMEYRFCEKCNTNNPKEAKYCLNCGSTLSYLRGNRK